MGYSYQGPMENTAKAKAVKKKVSSKKTTETCNAIKGMNVQKALEYLEKAKNKEKRIPFKKHNKKRAHGKKGQPGGYPTKSIKRVKETVESALKNAEYKGLQTEKMDIVHASAYKSGSIPRQAKKLSAKSKTLTTIEIILKQKESD